MMPKEFCPSKEWLSLSQHSSLWPLEQTRSKAIIFQEFHRLLIGDAHEIMKSPS